MTPDAPILLLTRPTAASNRFLADARAVLGPVPAIVSPILKIVAVGEPPMLDDAVAVILTSVHAVPQEARGMTAYCVGDRTAEVAAHAGLNAVSGGGDAEDLIALITAGAPRGRLVHLRGRHGRGDIARRLRRAGLEVEERVVYDQRACPLTAEARRALAGETPVVAPLFSPRSALLLARASRGARAPLTLVAISAAAGAAWTGPAPARRVVAARPDAAAVLDCLADIYGARET